MEAAKLFLVVVCLMLPFTSGSISDQCLKCICDAESNCKPEDCTMDVGSLSCGYYQIKSPYFQDCRMRGRDWKTCAKDKTCATTCVRNYMARYQPRSGCPDTCETYARIHNGGPRGCTRNSTLRYWQRVKTFGC